jgi:hypothetical protein
MIYQTDRRLDADINAIGCAFDSMAYFRERYQHKPWTAEELQAAWDGAIATGIISPDANHDGDLLDKGEGEIQSWQALANYLGCAVQFLGFFPPGAPERVGNFVIARWFNPRTNFRHFVVGDLRPVEWDPIKGGSVTVREGAPDSLRIFKPLVAMV